MPRGSEFLHNPIIAGVCADGTACGLRGVPEYRWERGKHAQAIDVLLVDERGLRVGVEVETTKSKRLVVALQKFVASGVAVGLIVVPTAGVKRAVVRWINKRTGGLMQPFAVRRFAGRRSGGGFSPDGRLMAPGAQAGGCSRSQYRSRGLCSAGAGWFRLAAVTDGPGADGTRTSGNVGDERSEETGRGTGRGDCGVDGDERGGEGGVSSLDVSTPKPPLQGESRVVVGVLTPGEVRDCFLMLRTEGTGERKGKWWWTTG
jgi:hypothetical protein